MDDGFQTEVFGVIEADDEDVGEDDDDLDQHEEGDGVADFLVEGALEHLERGDDVDCTDDCLLNRKTKDLDALHRGHVGQEFLVGGFVGDAELENDGGDVEEEGVGYYHGEY